MSTLQLSFQGFFQPFHWGGVSCAALGTVPGGLFALARLTTASSGAGRFRAGMMPALPRGTGAAVKFEAAKMGVPGLEI